MKEEGKLASVLNGSGSNPPPIWLMRQAGRYLPEYRELRAKVGSFWAMCAKPEIAAEITLQPIRRFGFDAAIIFSDILVVPVALGIDVSIEEGFGPRLKAIGSVDQLIDDPARWQSSMSPVYRALQMVRRELPPGTALIGFAGAPWTLATYLAQGHGSDDQRAAKLWGYRDPVGFDVLLERLTDAVAKHLIGQLEAGADAVQIFDSWASGLPYECYLRWVVEPTRNIVSKIRSKYPGAKIIGFPRATSLAGYQHYAQRTGVDVVSVDTATPIGWAAEHLAPTVAVQGNLDPIALIAGGAALDRSIDNILEAMRGTRFIFNLGHGILQETPVEHVARLVSRVRASSG